MSQIGTNKETCGKCHKKLKKSQFKISCSLCTLTFDIKCQGLSRNDVKRLANLNIDRYWTCNSCTDQIFPEHYIDAEVRAPRHSHSTLKQTPPIISNNATKFWAKYQKSAIYVTVYRTQVDVT